MKVKMKFLRMNVLCLLTLITSRVWFLFFLISVAVKTRHVSYVWLPWHTPISPP